MHRRFAPKPRSASSSSRRSTTSRSIRNCSTNSARPSTRGPACFSTGAPGNGKSTLARRITVCFGQEIWIPRTLIEDGQLIKLYDAAYHTAVEKEEHSLLKSADHDRRWIKVRRPTVIVGGELTMNNLEIEHDPARNVSEAPLQMKSNCGCLLIDDFGRQRIEPMELLNRWIVPLENRIDFLTLATGKKIQVPFEQLIIFSTNLDPADLADEAFLRRIPYKIEVGDPKTRSSTGCFAVWLALFGCTYQPEAVEYLLETHYRPDAAASSPLPPARPAAPDSQLLHVQRPGSRDATGVLRPGREELLHDRQWFDGALSVV